MYIKSIFKKGELLLADYYYSFGYLVFLVTTILYKEGDLTVSDIFKEIEIINPLLAKSIISKRFEIFLEQQYVALPKQRFTLYDEQIEMYDKVNKVTNKLEELLRYSKTELCAKAIRGYELNDYTDLIISSLIIFKDQKIDSSIRKNDIVYLNDDKTKILAMYYEFLDNESDYISSLKRVIENIKPSYDSFLLSDLILDKAIIDYLFLFDISLIKDIRNGDIHLLVHLFNNNLKYYLDIFKTLSYDLNIYLDIEVNDLFNDLSKVEIDIIGKRNGWDDGKKLKLGEIGEYYTITKERIRQIEKATIIKIKTNSVNLRTSIICLFKVLSKGDMFVSKEKIDEYFNDDLLCKKICLLLKDNEECRIKYDDEYEFFYDSQLTTVDEVVNSILAKFGNVIIEKEIEDEMTLRIIRHFYDESNGKFKKKGLPTSAFILDIIDTHFPNGYHISSVSSQEKVRREYEKKYNEPFKGNNFRVINSALNNNNYRLIARGTYKNPIYCPVPSEELLEKIMEYINSQEQIVYYNSIYATFEKELLELGINNGFFIKGTLDYYLRGYNTKRDYIVLSYDDVSGSDAILRTIKSFEGKFSMDQLREAFPGVQEYVFTNVLYKQKNLISLANKNYIYLDKLGYSQNTFDSLFEFIEENLKDHEWVSSHKLLEKLKKTKKSLLKDLRVVNSHFDLYSLIKALFKDKVYCQRPLLSLQPIKVNSLTELPLNYARSLDKFNKKIIDTFIFKNSIQEIYDYTKFMEILSDEYIQIDVDTMVKKTKLVLSDKLLEEIEASLDLIFSKYKEIDTRTFQGYYLLPECKIKWNKYSLKGIINSYFSDKYLTEVTDRYYHITDFIISRI